ncbi:hypothetical protein Y032_0075g982 [Ancylostoma ceylanicum]|uniref:Uncharacterized protein n=1 Tax=Ancylostoma ceylanicum TaxID=53326 RepID=A0A016TVG5_9BILA|nr:hypothetical protein Y032_0075g982 [Ancylostoma ceylanicum]
MVIAAADNATQTGYGEKTVLTQGQPCAKTCLTDLTCPLFQCTVIEFRYLYEYELFAFVSTDLGTTGGTIATSAGGSGVDEDGAGAIPPRPPNPGVSRAIRERAERYEDRDDYKRPTTRRRPTQSAMESFPTCFFSSPALLAHHSLSFPFVSE